MNPFAYTLARRFGSILPLPVREALYRHNLTTIRQSSYKDARACSQRACLSGSAIRYYGVEALFGSAFHQASEDIAKKQVLGDQDYWYTTLNACMTRNDNAAYKFQGNLVQDHQLVDWARGMATGEPWSMPLIAIVQTCNVHIKNAGIRVIAREKKLSWSEPIPFPISFEGTLDHVSKIDDEWAIGDLKSWGLWGSLLGTGAIKAQNVSPDDLYWDPQLQHYDWMSWRLSKYTMKAGWYYQVLPANIVPYKQKGRVGEVRGNCVVTYQAPDLSYLKAYEQDLVAFYTALANYGPQRGRPTSYGKLDCATCHVLKSCLGDPTARQQAAALKDPFFHYEP